MKELQLHDPVYIRNFGQGSIWWKGKIVNRHGPLTWLMELEDGRVIQRHADHVRVRHDTADISIQDHVIDDRGIAGRRNTNDETSDIPTPPSLVPMKAIR